MIEPIPLARLFTDRIFRIPDYQRGYAWQHGQLKAFWEDLVNLPKGRSHYTGVLTLKEIPSSAITTTAKEHWLAAQGHRVYHVVDGQQRLTTFVVFVQACMDYLRALAENAGKSDDDIFITDSISLEEAQTKYLFKVKPRDEFRTYKFGYTDDNPSDRFLRHRILGEPGGARIEETFYTLNLRNAKDYFTGQLEALYLLDGTVAVWGVFEKLTTKFLFNEYVIRDEFDVFVAFETMNNRGKKLSDLELLKNRLIYLTTIYEDHELSEAGRDALRREINDAWKEVYHQLGRNEHRPLNDDEFLRAHWTMFFKYSRKTGRDYIHFLLGEHFTPQRVHKKTEKPVLLDAPQEQLSDDEVEEEVETADEPEVIQQFTAELAPRDIREFVASLKQSAVHWFNSWHPEMAAGMSRAECERIGALNRIGIGYFRPLVMVVLKNEKDEATRLALYRAVERFIFVAFRLNSAKSNFGSSEFSNVVRAIDRGEKSPKDVVARLDVLLGYTFHEDGTFRSDDFYNLLFRRFKAGVGYYGWSGLRYFLFEYELNLLAASRQVKVGWSDLLKTEKDMVSVEHIYPQTETPEWALAFAAVDSSVRANYQGSLGNLLLLSRSINSSLQNISFAEKRDPKFDPSGTKIRNGYSDGSHSEIDVAKQYSTWGPHELRRRGSKLLGFLETRWDLKLRNEDRERLLFLTALEAEP
ncbi:MAG: DUF262 domain-containing protein [Planctomycetota bacterium]|nr:DUF262 domain-containing protein [Planctomycetota bacterium]